MFFKDADPMITEILRERGSSFARSESCIATPLDGVPATR